MHLIGQLFTSLTSPRVRFAYKTRDLQETDLYSDSFSACSRGSNSRYERSGKIEHRAGSLNTSAWINRSRKCEIPSLEKFFQTTELRYLGWKVTLDVTQFSAHSVVNNLNEEHSERTASNDTLAHAAVTVIQLLIGTAALLFRTRPWWWHWYTSIRCSRTCDRTRAACREAPALALLSRQHVYCTTESL